MYKYASTLLLLLIAACCLGQPSISGTIEDSAHNALPYSTVALMTPEHDRIIKGTIADDNGRFSIAPIAAGQYAVQVTHNGFIDYTSPAISIDPAGKKDLGIIVLHATANSLAGVSVTAQRPAIEFKNGSIVLHVANDLLANGNTVLELLKRLPGVMVDAQNNVTIDGRGGIGFLLDGRLQQIPAAQIVTMLNGMPAESIASIELIRNPPAKYDAAGTSGLINIVSKKVKLRGLSGNVSESVGYGRQGGNTMAASLNYKTNKLTIITNTGYTYKDVLTDNIMNRTLNDQQGTTTIHANGRSETFLSAFNFKGTLEYTPAERTTLGITVMEAPTTSNEYIRQTTDISGTRPFAYDRIVNQAYNPEQYNNPSVGVYVVHSFDSIGTQLSANADLTYFTDRYSGLNRNSFFYNGAETNPMLAYNNHIDLTFRIMTQKVDMTKMLTQTLALHAGEKTSFTDNNNNSSVEQNTPGTETYYTNSSFGNSYDYNEQILAGYVDITKALPKGSAQIGLRGEQTNIDAINHANGYTFQQHYFSLFPSVSMDYAINPKNSIQLSYSYRIDRPAYNQLNPIRIFNDALNYSAGNAELKPQYSHKIIAELSHGNALHFSAGYTHTDNSIYNYSFTAPGTQTNVDTTFNFAFSDQVVLGAFAQYSLAKWYSMQAMANLMYGNRRGIIDNAYATNGTLAAQGSINNAFALPHDMRLQLNARYTSPYQDGVQLYHQRGSVDVAIQKRLLKGTLNATLGVYDLLYTDKGSYTSTLAGQQYAYAQRPDTRRVRLTLNYRFGNMKIDRKVNDDNERNSRIKKGS